MELYGTNSRSLPQKFTILLAELGLIVVSYLVLFGDLFVDLRAFSSTPHEGRNAILFVFNVTVFLRFLLTLFVFLRRKIPLEETFSVPLAFALYLLGFPLLARGDDVEMSLVEFSGVALFVVGSFLNTYGEYQRHVFKRNPENKGRLYRKGLFSLSIHINYFGDLLWVSGYALVTHNVYSVAVPIVLFCFFQFFNIPQLDAHLRERYGDAFLEYERKTKRFVPFVL